MVTLSLKKFTTMVPSKESQTLILDLASRILTEHRKFSSYLDKMEVIDKAYARYKEVISSDGIVAGQGIDAATTPVGVLNMPSTTPPVIVSQVDSMVAYLADVFLSGTPLFPIVSSPEGRADAEKLETLLDDHANLGGYARQLLMFLRDGVKYNFSAIEADWTSIDSYSSMEDILQPGTPKLAKDRKSYTKLHRLDPYNTIWDYNVPPGDASTEGDYAGYVDLISRPKLKRYLQRLNDDGLAFNTREALKSSMGGRGQVFRMAPTVSGYISSRRPETGMNWYTYLTGKEDPQNAILGDNFERFTFYARICPGEFKLDSPSPKTIQIWKFVVINNEVVVQARRILSAFDNLPIFFGQPLEDGLGYQTASVAEGNIPFQTSAATLFNISFNAARRAVSDRALYDKDMISASDINSPIPAPKIPVKTNSLGAKRISDAYHQIPFDARGTEGALDAGMRIVSFGRELSGLNAPLQGQFQRGNKSVVEWTDTMGNADARLRLPALVLEHQVFQPLKNTLKLNIFQYGEDAVVVSQKTGETLDINIAELRRKVLAFRVADGYTPKSKLAGTDTIMAALQIIGQSQLLQQQFGPALPNIFMHLMQLAGVRGMEEYIPPAAPQTQVPALGG